ncbi:MAG: hypothetical protein QM501_06915 [Gimesia sp.]
MKATTHQNHILFVVLLLVSLTVFGCGSDQSKFLADPPIPEAAPISGESSNSDRVATKTPALTEFDGIRFKVPKGWEQVALSPEQQGFVTASFKIPHAGNDVKLTLSSVGGGIDANLKRWVGQFQLPPGESPLQKSIRVDTTDAIWLDLRGTFDSGAALNSKSESGMRMIGVAIPRNPRDFYLKLTGPREQLLNAEKEFQDFVKSARFVQ